MYVLFGLIVHNMEFTFHISLSYSQAYHIHDGRVCQKGTKIHSS